MVKLEDNQRKILKSQKNVFWEALVIAVFIFGCGLLLGVFIENSRAGAVSDMYLQSELNLLDIKVQSDILEIENLDCEKAIEANIRFGDKVFEDARTLEKYEDASRVTNLLVEQHKKYDLLRTIFWVNSIKLKEKCNADFHTLVYLYDYNNEDESEKSKQEVFSRFLEELKTEKGNKVILIPIARDMGLSSLDLLVGEYNLTGTSIILDEEFVVSEPDKLDEISSRISF